MKIKILIDLRRFFSNAQRRSLTSELSEDQNHINFPDEADQQKNPFATVYQIFGKSKINLVIRDKFSN